LPALWFFVSSGWVFEERFSPSPRDWYLMAMRSVMGASAAQLRYSFGEYTL
jgi:hypothetical protein